MVTFFILVYLLSWGSYQKTALQVKNQATTVNFLLILSGMIEPSSVCGFLCPFFSYTEGWGGEVKIGKLLQGLVRTIDKVRKVVYLSSDPDTITKSVVCFLCINYIVILVSILMILTSLLTGYLTYFLCAFNADQGPQRFIN